MVSNHREFEKNFETEIQVNGEKLRLNHFIQETLANILIGFLKTLNARVIRFNVWGDVQFIKGKVIDKYMTGDESIIKVEVWAENQKDEITAQGQGEVVLPMTMLERS